MIEGETLPLIDTPRVRLRWVTDADVDAIYAVFSDRKMMQYWSTTAMTARAEAEDYVRRIHEGFRSKTLFQWGVELKQEGRVAGTCTLFHLDTANRRAEIGYCLASPYWRNGYMKEALTALFDYAFGPMALRRLEADVDPRNEGSLRILERLGFRNEGLLRERWNVGGEIQDSAFLGLLAKEWPPQTTS